MKKLVLVLMVGVLFMTVALVSASEKVSLPKGYAKWAKSKQIVVTDKKSLFYGVHYIYVDNKAMKTYKSGGVYPEGSRFVVDYFNVREVNGKPVAGKKNMIVLMQKDKKYKATGGWLFAGFNPDGRPSGIDPVKNCYECHVKEAKDRDLVISRYANFK